MPGSAAMSRPAGQWGEALAQRVGDESVLVAVLGIVEQFLRERVILGGGRAAPDRPCQRHRLQISRPSTLTSSSGVAPKNARWGLGSNRNR